MAAVVDSLSAHRPALLRVHAPDPVTCGVAPERVSRLARAAVESRAVPVYVVGRDAPVHVDLNGNPDLAADWTTHQLAVSDASGTPSTLDTDLTVADWALQQARFRAHFRVMSRGHRNDRTRPLSAFLALAPDAREGLQPYIDVRDSAGRHAIALVSRELARMAEQARRDWRELRGASESRQAPVTAAATPVAPAASATAPDPAALGVLTENLLRLCGFGSDDPFFKRSLRDFVARERSNGDDGE
jgi:pyruvate-ferredoxin/flavodoxin oxidoreductase